MSPICGLGTHLFDVFIIFAERLLLIALFFPFSALDKILNFDAAIGQASQAFHSRWFATLLIAAGFTVEVVMSLGVLTGLYDRLAAFILAGYCMLTAVLWKQFWKQPDFRLKGESHGRDTFWDFLKNLALAGGFLVLALGSTPASVHSFLTQPLVSSHPYTR
jgi:putative oxidoreductase